MSDQISKEISLLTTDIPKLKDFGADYLFSAVCVKYFFNEGHYSLKDFKSTFVDGKNDGGIDLILVDEDEDKPKLIFVQGKYISELANKQDIVDIFTKMDQTIRDLKSNKFSAYNDKLKKVFVAQNELVQDQNPGIPQLILFIDVEVDEKKKEWAIERLAGLCDDYEITIYDSNQIIEQIDLVKNPALYVNEDKIDWAKEDGHLTYGKDGLLVNVYANSVRSLYIKHKDQGLFAQNFRYYVRNKKIDDSVKHTLDKRREDFWYLNNGIIIGCKDYRIDGNKIKLFDFSIINGCQTTTMIGQHGDGENFKVHCKIVKSTEHGEGFVAEIAEASNSQKPILDRDLKANYPEQKKLKSFLEGSTPPVYLEIKRGADHTKPKKSGKEEWQFVKNDALGQMLLAFSFQQPGTARANKQKIFGDNETYNKLFKRPLDAGMIVDLLKLNYLYERYCDQKLADGTAIDEVILSNSEKVMLALFGFLVKVKRGLVDPRKSKNIEQWSEEVSKDDIRGSFLNEDAEKFQMILGGLFTAFNKLLKDSYSKQKDDSKGVSNFLKLDSRYKENILIEFVQATLLNDYELEEFEKKYFGIIK